MSRAIEIIRKVLRVLPILVEVVAEVEAARAADSPGGSKVTPGELAALIGRGVSRIGEALLAVIVFRG